MASESLVELIDLYPTLCELSGLSIPPHCQGLSFANLFDDPEAEHRTSAYSAYPAEAGVPEKEASGMVDAPPRQTPDIGMGHSIRFGNYRYTEWRPGINEPATASVLTDLQGDPGETENVITLPAHSDALERAKKLLDERVTQATQGRH